jgi:hypothetical protein
MFPNFLVRTYAMTRGVGVIGVESLPHTHTIKSRIKDVIGLYEAQGWRVSCVKG